MDELTPEMNYRFTIIEAIDFLNQTKKELFTKLVNTAMAGEYNDSDFDEGDEITFDISHFQNCKDNNVQTLIKQLKAIQNSVDSLKNDNNIQDDELGIKIE